MGHGNLWIVVIDGSYALLDRGKGKVMEIDDQCVYTGCPL